MKSVCPIFEGILPGLKENIVEVQDTLESYIRHLKSLWISSQRKCIFTKCWFLISFRNKISKINPNTFAYSSS